MTDEVKRSRSAPFCNLVSTCRLESGQGRHETNTEGTNHGTNPSPETHETESGGPQALVEHTQRCASLLLRYIALNMSMSMYSGVGTYRTTLYNRANCNYAELRDNVRRMKACQVAGV